MLSALQLYKLGLANERRGVIDRALRFYAAIVANWPTEIAAYHRLSVLALQRKDPGLAVAWIDKALPLNDGVLELWNNRAVALAELGRFDEAHESIERALTIAPDNWESYFNLGRMLLVQGQFAEAEQALARASELDPYSAPTWNNFGLVLTELHRHDEAIAAFDRALELAPDYVEALANKGSAHYRALRFSEAQTILGEAIALVPGNARLHCELACVLRSDGNLTDGFREQEWRWRLPESQMRFYAEHPLWSGEPIPGETLLVWPEPGLRESIQYIRFIHDLAKLDCELIVEVPNELHRIYLASFSLPNVRIVHVSAEHSEFDRHVPLGSVPRLLDARYETLRPPKPYLHPRASEADEWRRKLKSLTPVAHRKKRRIGIVWSGNSENPRDRQRSLSWETFAPIVEANKRRFQFFSLQKDGLPGDPDVISLGESLRDFGVTASIMMNLDIIISVDTAAGHLAGALGRRVWTMHSYLPSWQWKRGEERTPWYSTMLVFPQKIPGAWDGVIREINETLALE